MTEAILSPMVPKSFFQVSHPPPLKNRGSTTATDLIYTKSDLQKWSARLVWYIHLLYTFFCDTKH